MLHLTRIKNRMTYSSSSTNTENIIQIGQLLLNEQLVRSEELLRALELQQATKNERIGAILIRLGLISEKSLLQALSAQLRLPIVDERSISECQRDITDFHEAANIPPLLATKLAFFIIPNTQDEVLRVVARDPLDSTLIEYLESGPCRGKHYRLSLVAARDFERTLAQIYRPRNSNSGDDLRKLAEDAPVVELVNGVMARATDTRASDVHFEPEEGGFSVRYRIDGSLHSTEHYSRERFDAVISRIKLISGLDIAERRLPQDGRFSIRTAGIDTDVRVSVIPGVLGESLVLRLLPNTQGTRFDLNNLGIEPDHLALYRAWMAEPDGIVLVTGPTGSGKSTTLYATLVACDVEHERILTVEDPVEYQIPGVTQFQVHPDIGFTFPAALRAILRHDPDTIMIGEIRDVETARIAVQSSLTGHRVFSTLHTNDCATAFLRLADMGVEPFLVGATVRGVVAQRLVRRLCNECAQPIADENLIPVAVKQRLSALQVQNIPGSFRRAVGCPHCNDTGYHGRIAVYELLAADDALRSALNQPSPSIDSLMRAIPDNYRSLRDDALLKAARGITSLEEVYSLAGGGELRER